MTSQLTICSALFFIHTASASFATVAALDVKYGYQAVGCCPERDNYVDGCAKVNITDGPPAGFTCEQASTRYCTRSGSTVSWDKCDLCLGQHQSDSPCLITEPPAVPGYMGSDGNFLTDLQLIQGATGEVFTPPHKKLGLPGWWFDPSWGDFVDGVTAEDIAEFQALPQGAFLSDRQHAMIQPSYTDYISPWDNWATALHMYSMPYKKLAVPGFVLIDVLPKQLSARAQSEAGAPASCAGSEHPLCLWLASLPEGYILSDTELSLLEFPGIDLQSIFGTITRPISRLKYSGAYYVGYAEYYFASTSWGFSSLPAGHILSDFEKLLFKDAALPEVTFTAPHVSFNPGQAQWASYATISMPSWMMGYLQAEYGPGGTHEGELISDEYKPYLDLTQTWAYNVWSFELPEWNVLQPAPVNTNSTGARRLSEHALAKKKARPPTPDDSAESAARKKALLERKRELGEKHALGAEEILRIQTDARRKLAAHSIESSTFSKKRKLSVHDGTSRATVLGASKPKTITTSPAPDLTKLAPSVIDIMNKRKAHKAKVAMRHKQSADSPDSPL